MNLVSMFEEYNVILKGHFKLTSGRHSDTFINKDRIFSVNTMFQSVIFNMAEELKNVNVGAITGPAIAGAVLAGPISCVLNKDFIYPEKIYEIKLSDSPTEIQHIIDSSKIDFRRGYDKLINGRSFAIVEDIITTGGSVQKVIDKITEYGGSVEKVVVIWKRSNWKPEGIEISSLINQQIDSWEPEDCPLCKDKIELQDPKNL